MRVELRKGVWSDEIPHEKCKTKRGYLYYFAKTPIGDYAVHAQGGDWTGYNGDEVEFLMTDGTIETVRGPWHRDGCYDYGDHEDLANHLKRPEIAVEATKIRVGTGLWLLGENPVIHFEEKDWVLGDWKTRFRKEWKPLQYEIVTVSGSRFGKVRDYVY